MLSTRWGIPLAVHLPSFLEIGKEQRLTVNFHGCSAVIDVCAVCYGNVKGGLHQPCLAGGRESSLEEAKSELS